jgi:hypothetical protein
MLINVSYARSRPSDGGSSNGRTADSDSASLGSNPSPPASEINKLVKSYHSGEILEIAVGGAGSDAQGFGAAGVGGSFVVGPTILRWSLQAVAVVALPAWVALFLAGRVLPAWTAAGLVAGPAVTVPVAASLVAAPLTQAPIRS